MNFQILRKVNYIEKNGEILWASKLIFISKTFSFRC